jgi:hypothetical protein
MSARRRAASGSGRQAGSALLLTVVTSSVLTALGLAYLVLAGTEQVIATSGRDAEQLVHTADTAVRMVKSWFDQPVTGSPAAPSQVLHRFMGTYDLRNPAFYDRSRRLFDHDADPNTPPVTADGSPAHPFYRQGRSLWAPSPFLDIFHKPFRGDLTTTFMGSAGGPDLLLEDRPNVIDLIDVLDNAIFTDQERSGRIDRIALYAPPRIMIGGELRPAGFVTVEITVAKYRRLGRLGILPLVMNQSRKIAERRVKVVLGEVPAAVANGPLESCGGIQVDGALSASWGKIIAGGDIQLSSDLDGMVASAFPYAAFDRRIHGIIPGDDYHEWVNDPESLVEDPWLKVIAGGDLAGYGSLAGQPLPFDQSLPIGEDHSNLFQRAAGVECGRPGYLTLRSAALSGDEHARYFTWDAATGLFREQGTGPAMSVRDWTHNAEGLFFFDTRDALPPNGHGPGDPATNLTPEVIIENTDWAFSGLLYLNAESIRIRNASGVLRVIIPPGEPFDDANANGLYDPGEVYANLLYPTSVVAGSPSSAIRKDPIATQSATATSPDLETYSYATSPARDGQGIPLTGEVNLFGVLYNAGNIDAVGPARHFGSLIAGSEIVQSSAGADAPQILFDQRLNEGTWPPAEIAFPRTHVSRWGGPS